MLQPWSLFILRNESAEPMRLTLFVSGRTVWYGDLRSGGAQAALSIVDRDTGIRVTCAKPGSAPLTTEGGYLTHSLPHITTIQMQSCALPGYEIEGLP